MLLWTGTRKILKYCHELPGGSSDFPIYANNAQGEKGDVLKTAHVANSMQIWHNESKGTLPTLLWSTQTLPSTF